MKILHIILIPLICLLFIIEIRAKDYVAAGIFCGYRHDEGNTEVYPEMIKSSQKNIIPGAVMKFDLWPFFFFRIGFSRSIPLTKGAVEKSSYGALEEWSINYYSLPWHIAMSFPIEESGRVYMGAGVTYFFTDGYIKSTEKYSVAKNLFGYGFILGGQAKVFGPVDIFIECEYVHGKTAPLADTTMPADNIKDYPADLSGARINAGILYYLIMDES